MHERAPTLLILLMPLRQQLANNKQRNFAKEKKLKFLCIFMVNVLKISLRRIQIKKSLKKKSLTKEKIGAYNIKFQLL